MKVVLTDGTELSCRNFKAIDSGVLLTKDKKRKKVVGFVPSHQLRYVVRDDVDPVAPTDATREVPLESGSDRTEASEPPADATTGSDLRRLGGLGSTYAERLQSAGFETLSDLAAADPVAVSEAAAVAPGRGRRWVNAAIRATGADEQRVTDVEADSEPVSDDADDASSDSGGEADDSDDQEGDSDDEVADGTDGADAHEHDTEDTKDTS